MMAKERDYKESLYRSFKNDDEAAVYLDEALIDPDREVFLLALRDVVEARLGGIASLAKKAGLNRESIYRTL
jgi:probable addiction module antidote protein